MPPKRHALSRLQASLPSGPSLIVDDGQSTQQILANGGVLNQAAPQRPKIHVTEQAMDEALQLSTEGKITSKNAWDIKLIEGLDDSVRHCIEENDGDDDQYQQFTRAANLVEGGAKVWTHRVESTYLLSTQMVRRLLRNDGREDVEADEEGGEENQTQQQTKKKKKKNLERTIAVDLQEIDQDRSQRAAQTQGTISPMFRAMTEKFDQGHAQGLLSHNVPFGSRLNHILDVDFALMSDKEGSIPVTMSEMRESQSQAGLDAEDHPDTLVEDFAVPLPRLSQDASSPATGRLSKASAKSPAFSMDMGAEGLQSHMIPRTTDVTMSGVNSRAGSVAVSKVDSSSNFGGAMSSYGELDQQPDFDDAYDDGGDDYGDDGFTEEEAADARSLARGVASGAQGMEALDTFLGSREAALGIAAEDAEWTPLVSQPPATNFGAQKSSKVMGDIRKQSVLGRKATAKSDDTEDVLASKRKKSEKGSTATLTKIPANLFELDRVDPKMNKTVNTALTPLGRRWVADDFDGSVYVKKEYQMKRAQEHNFILNAQYDSATVTRECPTLTYIPDEPSDVRAFFQPFSCHESRWNILFKTLRHANQAAGATSNISRFDNGGFTEDVVAEMPVDVFMDNDDGGYDDDADYGADVHFDVPAGPQIELPDFGGDAVEEPTPEEVAVPGPDAIKRLRMTYATAPTQVDVVRLRRVMWDHTQRVTQAHPVQNGTPDQPSGQLDFDGEEHHFSDVVTSMLPQVPSIAKSGSLSPAFFFFSMLFLVNQHGIDLHQGEGGNLNDLVIKGFIPQGKAPEVQK